MKKVIALIALIFSIGKLSAQVTDTGDKVGIGTTSPTVKLDVRFSPSGSGINTPLFINPSSGMATGEVNAIMFSGRQDTDKKAAIGYQVSETGYFRGDFVFYLNDEPNHNSVTLSNEVMKIKRNGTLDFNFKPQGYGINSPLLLEPSSGMSSGEVNAIMFTGRPDTDRKAAIGYQVSETGYFRGDLVFYINNQANHNAVSSTDEVLRIKNDGNVGIGTDNPQSKLSVEGQIRATEVKVLADISVPDYVFESGYELRTLQETKEYISKNKHLPEIPSASEIEENGIDLGDMDMRLLKKIEELTLYLIEQNKEIQELKKEVSALKNG